ncbi:MAG: peptidylprolyl isomerase [Lachnospiraceae bacterium]|nr:peptidylprolyl isomerase [Lachnospiraceae bacterium]
MRKIVKAVTAFFLAFTLVFAAGCGIDRDTKVVLTTGFAKDEIFKIDDVSCTVPEMMVYLTNIQNQYEQVYGREIWDKDIEGVSLESNVKDNALSKLAQIKTIVLLAKQRGIVLDEKETEVVAKATDMYYDSLNSVEISEMGITRDTIYTLYSDYALAQKTYRDMIRDVNPEISDDEARTITVQHIVFKTYAVDDDGIRVSYPDKQKQEIRKTAENIAERAKAGEDMTALATELGIEENITVSFGKGEVDPVLETAGFDLGTDEVSDVIETEFGYHVLKCISTFNREETDENKLKIADKRKQEAFSEEYEVFVKTLTKALNEPLWDEISFIHDPNVTTSDFFEVYDEISSL